MSDSSGIRSFLEKPAGQAVAFGVVALGIAIAVWSFWSNLQPAEAVADANNPWFIDAETKKAFRIKLSADLTIPAKSPDTGKLTAYPAELCFWTKDGKPKTEPTPVLLRSYLGQDGPTFCPDCGRLVRPHNPLAQEGAKPPPTEAEYKRR